MSGGVSFLLLEHLQLHRGRQEECRMHLATTADGPRRVSQALCQLVQTGGLTSRCVGCVSDGVKLVQRLSFPVHEMHGNLMEMLRHLAWAAGHAAESGDEAELASTGAAAQKLIMAVLEMEGGARQVQFRRNVEVVLLGHLFADEASAESPLLALR